jgi:hypothetical protein
MEKVGMLYVHLEYIVAIWYTYFMVIWHLVAIWYIFHRFGILYPEKSGKPGTTHFCQNECTHLTAEKSRPNFTATSKNLFKKCPKLTIAQWAKICPTWSPWLGQFVCLHFADR